MSIFRFVKKLKELWDWLGLVWQLVGLLGFAGFAVSIGGTVWAMLLGLPPPFILMAAFCTLVAAVYLAMAPMAYLALSRAEPIRKPTKTPAPINYSAIRLQHQYPLAAASKLWVGIHPSTIPTADSQTWFETLQSAIQRGTLKFVPRNPGGRTITYEQQNPDLNTLVTREELKKFASSIGADPEFLRDR
jgi:hypothetical protein